MPSRARSRPLRRSNSCRRRSHPRGTAFRHRRSQRDGGGVPRACPAGEGALGTQEREAFSPHPSQFEVAVAAVQGPDVGIGTTVEDADELPPRHAAAASTLRCSTPPPLPHRRSLRAPRLDADAASAHQYSTPPQLLRPASHLRATLLAAAASVLCIRRSGPPRSIPLTPLR